MQVKNIIVIMGPPGSGKGTQSKLLGEKLGYTYFSTGALLREIAKQHTPLGKEIASYIHRGIIIPDEMMTEIFRQKIGLMNSIEGLILDGFPRTVGQVKILGGLFKELGNPKVRALFLEVDKQKLLDRVIKRGEGRADDDPSVIEKRFEEYINKTAPVKDHYEKLGELVQINGDRPIEEVHSEIINKLGL
ncbi:MAG: nucleoside monophosphate kinase [Candidatus Doudnabacteria bacterium]|nr:nucleoside monophosphate kinase [Candidatus Doudnabacteria bacterium]